MLQTAARAEQRNIECILWFHPFIQPTINNLFEPFSYFGDCLQFCGNITQAEKVKAFKFSLVKGKFVAETKKACAQFAKLKSLIKCASTNGSLYLFILFIYFPKERQFAFYMEKKMTKR